MRKHLILIFNLKREDLIVYSLAYKFMIDARDILGSLKTARFTSAKQTYLYIFNLMILYQLNS